MTFAERKTLGVIVSIGRAFVLIYAVGAGYFGYLAVPSPLNFVVAPALFVALVVVVAVR